SPADLLGQDGPRAAAAAVFGLLFSSLCQLLLDPDPLPLVSSASPGARELWKLAALLYYPVLYFPLLGCAGLRHRLGYAAGTLLAWGHCGAQLGHRLQCPLAHKITPTFPHPHGTFHIPAGLGNSWESSALPKSIPFSISPQIPGKSYYRKYLKAVLSKRGQKGSSKIEESLWSRIRSYLRSYIYIPEEGFRIPLMLVVSVTMAVIAVYQVTPGTFPINPWKRVLGMMGTPWTIPGLTDKGFWEDSLPGGSDWEDSRPRGWDWEDSRGICWQGWGCARLARSVPGRSNLRALYQGAVLDVFSTAHILRPSRGAVVCWIGFSGFQAAFACLGLLIQQVIFFLCSVAFTFLVVIPLQAGTSSLLFRIIRNMWPFWLTLVLAVLVQHLLARFQFLEQHSLQKELTNRLPRRFLQMFWPGFLWGDTGGGGPAPLAPFPRLGNPRSLGIGQMGSVTVGRWYHTYCHYLKVDVSQCHPLLKAFCLLLLQPGRTQPHPTAPRDTHLEEGLQLMPAKAAVAGRARRLRARWCVAYTLLHNPSLAASRKTALADPAANGAQPGPRRP
ncbi:STRA6 protein, partial [Sylvia borin]|nr:STRA6 protein [Sylvia borin]